MTAALLIIDVQHWFFRSEERRSGLPDLIKGINHLVSLWEEKGLPVYHVLTVHRADRSTWDLLMRKQNQPCLIEGTEEAAELDEVRKGDLHGTVIKTRNSAFMRTDLENRLRNQGVETVVLSGLYTHGCIHRTALDAFSLDFQVIVAKEATFSHRREFTKILLEDVKTEVEVLTNDEIAQHLS